MGVGGGALRGGWHVSERPSTANAEDFGVDAPLHVPMPAPLAEPPLFKCGGGVTGGDGVRVYSEGVRDGGFDELFELVSVDSVKERSSTPL